MRKINIFVAGAQKLVNERNQIKILANKLNRYALNKGCNACVIIHSCEDFNDKQDEYNRFIEHEADIVIFVLDGCIGGKTEEEFLKATEAKYRFNRPEIMVFLRESEDADKQDIGRIKGLLAGRLGAQYYITYDSPNELKTKANERISRYIDTLSKENETEKGSGSVTEKSITGDKQAAKRSVLRKWVVPALLGIIVILCGLLCYNALKKNVLLIFAGGGSVKNYIQERRDVDIQDYPHSVYSNLASGSAWSLLLEEANRYEEDKGKSLERFTSICLSAGDIDSASFFNERALDIFPKERIKLIKYYLGNDSLAIYAHIDLLKSRGVSLDATSISVDSLRSLIKYALAYPQNVRMFTTTKTSGTLRMYQSCFSPSDSIDFQSFLDNQKVNLFYQNSSAAHIYNLSTPSDEKPYIIFGSKYYYPKTIVEGDESKSMHRMLIVKDGDTVIQKPMNLYFIAREKDSERDTYIIRKPIVKFLKSINAGNNMDPNTWNEVKQGKFKAKTGSLIQDLN